MVGVFFFVGFFVGVFLPSRAMAVASAIVAPSKGIIECGWVLLHSGHFQKKNDDVFASEI